MEPGEMLPPVAVTMDDGRRLPLGQVTNGLLVVYFYPRDDTAGCTREALDFSAAIEAFAEAGARVIGISRDAPASHAKFVAKHGLAVDLVSDEHGSVAQAFGVWGEKRLYGRTYMGLERATFLFGTDGRLIREWRKVRVPGHVDAVLAAARAAGAEGR